MSIYYDKWPLFSFLNWKNNFVYCVFAAKLLSLNSMFFHVRKQNILIALILRKLWYFYFVSTNSSMLLYRNVYLLYLVVGVQSNNLALTHLKPQSEQFHVRQRVWQLIFWNGLIVHVFSIGIKRILQYRLNINHLCPLLGYVLL